MEVKQKFEIAIFSVPQDVLDEVKARKSLIIRTNYDDYPRLVAGLADPFSLVLLHVINVFCYI